MAGVDFVNPSAACSNARDIGLVENLTARDEDLGLLHRANRFLAWLKTKNQIWGLADQLVVSGTSFAAMIVIARSTDVAQLGLYSIANSLIIMLLTVQDSLITRPYSIQIFKPTGTPEEHGFSSLLLSWIVALLGVVAALAVTFYFAFVAHQPGSAGLALAIAFVAPFVLFREFGRRYSFANLKVYRAFAVDLVASLGILGPMVYLGWSGILDAATAIMTIGCGAGLSGTLWFLRRRHAFRFSAVSLRGTLRQSWDLGKWLLCSQLAMQLQGYAVHWLCLLVIGAAITGTYAACLSIVALANPFLFGFFNLLTPKSVRTLKDRGPQELRRQVLRDSLLLGGLMSAFTVFIYFAGEHIMALLYAGEEYANHGNVLTVLSLASVASAIGAFGGPAAIALQSAERGRAIAAIAIATAVIGSLASWYLVANYALTGAAWGLLVTEVIGAIGRWALFIRLGYARPAPPGPIG